MPPAREVLTADGTRARRKPIVGDLHWDGSRWRRWSGKQWAQAAYSLHPEALSDPRPFHERPRVSEERRERALALAVEDQVATNGASVVLDGPSGVVLGYRRPVAHGMHAVLTLVTAGVWGVVWLATVFGNREDRIRLEPDAWGNVWARLVVAA